MCFEAQTVTVAEICGSAKEYIETADAHRRLKKHMLMERAYPSTGYIPPIYPELRRAPKLYWLETGLVNYSVKLQKEIFGSKDILDAWRGHIAEQIVAQELLAIDYKVSSKRSFWVRDKKGSDAEVDFIIQYDNKVIPIEVKSGHNAKLKSLHIFMEDTNHDIAVRVWSNPFSIDNILSVSGKKIKLINLPFYYVGSLFSILEQVTTSKTN